VMTETDEYRRLRIEGFDALYNMDYQGAREKFEKMTQLVPEHPAGYFYLATNFWLDLLNSSRRLQSSIYNSYSFYSDTKDKLDEKTDQEFRRLVQVAMDKAEAAVKTKQRDPEAIYYTGTAHGLLAS